MIIITRVHDHGCVAAYVGLCSAASWGLWVAYAGLLHLQGHLSVDYAGLSLGLLEACVVLCSAAYVGLCSAAFRGLSAVCV